MDFLNIYAGLFFFFNIEGLFFFIFIIIIIFVLTKKISLNLWLLYNVQGKFILINQFFFIFVNFLLFCVFNLQFLLYCLYDKRFFFFDLNYFNNNFIIISKFIILIILLFVFILSIDYFNTDKILKSFEFFLLIWLSVLGMFLMISNCDFISLYLCIELQSITFFILAGFKQNSIFSIEAGLKYFILGSFSSGLFLFGVSLIYFSTGLLNFYEIDFLLQQTSLYLNNLIFLIGILLFLISLLFKLSVAPFHMWSPDVYQGSPTIVTFFFLLVPKISFISFFIRLLSNFYNIFNNHIIFIFFIGGILSLLIGSLASVFQIKLKRLFAFSSISNIGFFSVLLFVNNIESLTTGFFFFVFYIFILTNIFIIFLGFKHYQNFFRVKNIYELFGLLKYNYIFTIILVTNLFSLLGLPPFLGFLIKIFLFINILQAQNFIILLICFISSVISGFVYLRLIRILLFNKYSNLLFFIPLNNFAIFIILTNFLLNFLLFKYSDFFFQFFFNCVLDNLIINVNLFF